MSPWHFPTVWLYWLAGLRKLISLMRNGANYQVILPQDGVFTAAFSGLAAKLAGVRVVCIDHAILTWLTSRVYRLYHAERVGALAKKDWHWTIRLLVRLLFELYRPSLYLLARISCRFVDHFLIPGVAGDGVEEICERLGVCQSRLTRFSNMIDIDRHVIPNAMSRANMREKNGFAIDAIIITMICRLAPEKGFDIALESISQALSTLSPDLRARVRVIIAGNGPLREEIEEGIQILGLGEVCMLWGEASPTDVISLLGLSDIFLYTSRRGVGYPLAILEAMGSGCAVVASSEPLANVHMLAEGRGIAVAVGDVEQTAEALVRLVNNLELCQQLGRQARNYVAVHHTAAMFRRTLMRATYWSGLDEILDVGKNRNR